MSLKLTDAEWRDALDIEVTKVLAERQDTMTYVVRNIIRRETPGWTWVETPNVLRSLRRLERRGLVEQVRSNYLIQLCWCITAAGRQFAASPAPKGET